MLAFPSRDTQALLASGSQFHCRSLPVFGRAHLSLFIDGRFTTSFSLQRFLLHVLMVECCAWAVVTSVQHLEKDLDWSTIWVMPGFDMPAPLVRDSGFTKTCCQLYTLLWLITFGKEEGPAALCCVSNVPWLPPGKYQRKTAERKPGGNGRFDGAAGIVSAKFG